MNCQRIFNFKLVLALLLLVTGSLNTLGSKCVNLMESVGNDDVLRRFQHPFLQTWASYIGGIGCMTTFLLIQNWKIRQMMKARKEGRPTSEDPFIDIENFNSWIFLPPALLDVISTNFTFTALTLTHPSSCQMLRGALIIFTALLSKFILGQNIGKTRWFGIIVILSGLVVVGSTDLIWADQHVIDFSNQNDTLSENSEEYDFSNPNFHPFQDVLLGDGLILCSQVLVAFQLVYEEKYIVKYNVPPLLVVSLEGFYGFFTMSLVLIPMYFIEVGPRFGHNPRNVLEDALEGFAQMKHNGILLATFTAVILSIAVYKFVGMTITKEMSSTTRVVIDSFRTLVIWIVSLSAGWQRFRWLRVVGFALFLVGMCIYHELGTSWMARKIDELLAWMNLRKKTPDENAEENLETN